MDIFNRVEIHPHARDDLKRIARLNRAAAEAIFAVLKTMQEDPEFQDKMLEHGAQDGNKEVKKWLNFFNQGKDLWRVKLWWTDDLYKLVPYRIIYAYFQAEPTRPEGHFYVLGIRHRDDLKYDDPTDEYTKRILDDYEAWSL